MVWGGVERDGMGWGELGCGSGWMGDWIFHVWLLALSVSAIATLCLQDSGFASGSMALVDEE